jgi:hypothetical protein
VEVGLGATKDQQCLLERLLVHYVINSPRRSLDNWSCSGSILALAVHWPWQYIGPGSTLALAVHWPWQYHAMHAVGSRQQRSACQAQGSTRGPQLQLTHRQVISCCAALVGCSPLPPGVLLCCCQLLLHHLCPLIQAHDPGLCCCQVSLPPQ